MQVISRLMEFEGKSYWEQIDMVCDELKKAGFIKESVKYTRGNHMDYYMKDGCEFVFIDLYNATINARQGIVMDKLVFESEGFAEKRATLSFKSRHATKANDDRTLVPLAFSEGSIVLHQLAMNGRKLPDNVAIDHVTHNLGICTREFLRVCSPQQNRCNTACYSTVDRNNRRFIISCKQMDFKKRLTYSLKGYAFKGDHMYSPSFKPSAEMFQKLNEFEDWYLGKFRYNPLYDFRDTFYAFVAWKLLGWGTEIEITEYNRDYIRRHRPEVAEYYRLGA